MSNIVPDRAKHPRRRIVPTSKPSPSPFNLESMLFAGLADVSASVRKRHAEGDPSVQGKPPTMNPAKQPSKKKTA